MLSALFRSHRNVKNHAAFSVPGAGTDPLDIVARIEKILNPGLQTLLRLDQSVMARRGSKIPERFPRPLGTVSSDIENVGGFETQRLHRREKSIEIARWRLVPLAVVDQLVTELAKCRLQEFTQSPIQSW